MKLSHAAAYALHALAHIAGEDPDRLVPSYVIAGAEGLPENFLLKVLRPLASAGLLRSVKGPNGGFRLARPAKDITLLEVVEAVDGPIRGEVPLSGTKGAGRLDARLAEVCDEAARVVRERLGKVRLAELVKG
jgi:Rrf2 family protein